MTNVNQNLQSFTIEQWFIFDVGEKDFETYTVEAENLKKAAEITKAKHRFPLNSFHNGQKISV